MAQLIIRECFLSAKREELHLGNFWIALYIDINLIKRRDALKLDRSRADIASIGPGMFSPSNVEAPQDRYVSRQLALNMRGPNYSGST